MTKLARGLLIALALTPILTAAKGLTAESWSAESLEECGQKPDRQSAACLYGYWRSSQAAEIEAAAALDSLIRLHPDAGWPRYYRGNLDRWSKAGEALIRDAAELFAAGGEISGEIRARADLVTLRGFDRDLVGSFAELQALRELVALSPLDEDRAIVDIAEAHYRMLSGIDQHEAYLRLVDAFETLEQAPDGYYFELKECLRALPQVTYYLGMAWEAADWAAAAEELARERGTLRDQATASFDAALTRQRCDLPNDRRRRKLEQEFQEVLELALRSGNDWVEASTRLQLAELVGGPEAMGHLERCRQLAVELRDRDLEQACTMVRASYSVDTDPELARRLLEETRVTGWGPWTPIEGWHNRLRVLWATRPLEEAYEGAVDMLSAIEAFRRNQLGLASDLLLSESADVYHWISGKLLEGDPDREHLRLAFAVIERLRAQALREALESSEERAQLPPEALETHAVEVDRINREYTEIYRQLLEPDLTPSRRELLLERLGDVERREASLQERWLVFGSSRAIPAPPSSDLLDRVQRELAADEALISYQLGMWEGWDRRFRGGAWVTVLTAEDVRVHPLPVDRAVVEEKLAILLGLADPEVPEALVRLHADLLQPALDGLPGEVEKLVIIPDGVLHRLPFSLLRVTVDGPPLVQRYEVQTVPSASLFLHWRGSTEPPLPSQGQALVLANPTLPAGASRSDIRSWEFASGNTLGPLPHAEREGQRVLRQLGGRGRLESGRTASEELLKSEDLSRFSILHLASHAVVNEAKPGRSAVMLAAGGRDQDGFLRPSEISRLEGLEGTLVVLSACDTASGSVLRGEGVLSLGRAFFEAGAQTVVASLWRLDDRLATRFFDDFYRHLRAGVTVSRALAETQREWSRRGRPASIWAGIVVLGNGELVPIPGGVPTPRWAPTALVIATLVILSVAAAVLLSRRRI